MSIWLGYVFSLFFPSPSLTCWVGVEETKQKMATKICEMWREMKAITAMVVVQIATAVLNILFKLAVVDGMEPRVLVAYRLFFATLFMIPLSLIFQRLFFSFCFDINYFDQLFSLFNSMWSAREKRPEFTWNLLLLALLSGLLGYVSFTHTQKFSKLYMCSKLQKFPFLFLFPQVPTIFSSK